MARGEDVLVRVASTASQEPGLESEFVFPLDLPPARLTGATGLGYKRCAAWYNVAYWPRATDLSTLL